MKNYPLLIIIFFAISILMVVFLAWPRYEEFQILEKEITQKKEELQSQESYYEQVSRASNELAKHKNVLAVVESAIPDDHSLPELLNFVQKAASKVGLVVKQVAPFSVASEIDTEIETTRINLDIEGDYIDLKEFLTIIEKSARFIETNKVGFSFPEEEDVFNFAVTLTVYHYNR
jgi:Tfp pilus assembly protein PilO